MPTFVDNCVEMFDREDDALLVVSHCLESVDFGICRKCPDPPRHQPFDAVAEGVNVGPNTMLN